MPTRPLSRIALALLAGLAARPAAADPPTVPPPTPPVRAFGDWRLDCAGGACALRSILRSTQPGAPELIRASLALDPSGGVMLTVRTPLGLYLPDPAILAPDETEPRSISWLTCTATGCTARILLDPDLLDALRRQRRASIAFTLADGSHVRLPLSLIGVSAGLAALKLSPAP
ncbi:MAG: invasion associated locus B family protein [Amaricoccus sp.]